MNNSIEQQIAELDNADDKVMFMEEYHMKEPALNKLIRSTYTLLELLTYFTAGVQEGQGMDHSRGMESTAGSIRNSY